MRDWVIVGLALWIIGSFFLGVLLGKTIKWGQSDNPK